MSRRVAVTGLLTVLAWALVAVPAQGRTGRHCAFRLEPVERHGNVVVAEPELIGCYATFAGSISAATGGDVRLADTMTPEQLTQSDLGYTTTSTDVVIGIEYLQTSFDGTSVSYSAPTTCSATNIWDVNYVGDTYNDKFSSGKGFGGCDHNKKFEHADFGGTVLTCTPNCSNYGALSNEVSSLRWRP